MTPEEIEDLHLRIKDMRLHGMLHMTGVYVKTSDDEESGNRSEKLEGSVKRLGHHVHNGIKWVEQQGKGQTLVENL